MALKRFPFLDKSEDEIRKQLATLTPREEQVLRMYYGIGEPLQYTLAEIGQRFSHEWKGSVKPLTKEAIRQIIHKAINKLNNPVRASSLEKFVQGL